MKHLNKVKLIVSVGFSNISMNLIKDMNRVWKVLQIQRDTQNDVYNKYVKMQK